MGGEFLGVVYELYFEPDLEEALAIEPDIEEFVRIAEGLLARDPTCGKSVNAEANIWSIRSRPEAFGGTWALFYTFDEKSVYFLALRRVPD